MESIKRHSYPVSQRNNSIENGMTLTGIQQCIDEEPTAYDVEKVVKHMENEAKRWQESGEEYQDEKELGVAEGFRRAVNIVKAGVVSENN